MNLPIETIRLLRQQARLLIAFDAAGGVVVPVGLRWAKRMVKAFDAQGNRLP
jgi:hypothetical protein